MQMPGVNRGQAYAIQNVDKLKDLDPRVKERVCRHEEHVGRQTQYSTSMHYIWRIMERRKAKRSIT